MTEPPVAATTMSLPEDGSRAVVAHLKLANWQFVKGPPLPPHGPLGKAPG